MPDVSVLMAVRDAANHLAPQLDALAGQLGDDTEAILVDDASTDGSSALLATFVERQGRATLIRNVQPRGKANCINEAARRGTGRVLVMLDHDDVIGPDYVRRLAAVADDRGLAFGRMEYAALNAPDIRAALWNHPDQDRTRVRFRDSDGTTRAVRIGSGACLAMRRDVWERLGGLALDVGCTDDVDLCLRAADMGHVYTQVPEAVVSYRFRRGYCALFRQRNGYGRGWGQLQEKYRERGMVIRSTPGALWDIAVAVGKILSPTRVRRLQGAAELGFSTGLVGGRIGRWRSREPGRERGDVVGVR
jgi:glycosyltransferase involved in cell wall biosynthesis